MDIAKITLSKSPEEDMNTQVDAKITPPHAVREQELILQQIAPYNDVLESLI